MKKIHVLLLASVWFAASAEARNRAEIQADIAAADATLKSCQGKGTMYCANMRRLIPPKKVELQNELTALSQQPTQGVVSVPRSGLPGADRTTPRPTARRETLPAPAPKPVVAGTTPATARRNAPAAGRNGALEPTEPKDKDGFSIGDIDVGMQGISRVLEGNEKNRAKSTQFDCSASENLKRTECQGTYGKVDNTQVVQGVMDMAGGGYMNSVGQGNMSRAMQMGTSIAAPIGAAGDTAKAGAKLKVVTGVAKLGMAEYQGRIALDRDEESEELDKQAEASFKESQAAREAGDDSAAAEHHSKAAEYEEAAEEQRGAGRYAVDGGTASLFGGVSDFVAGVFHSLTGDNLDKAAKNLKNKTPYVGPSADSLASQGESYRGGFGDGTTNSDALTESKLEELPEEGGGADVPQIGTNEEFGDLVSSGPIPGAVENLPLNQGGGSGNPGLSPVATSLTPEEKGQGQGGSSPARDVAGTNFVAGKSRGGGGGGGGGAGGIKAPDLSGMLAKLMGGDKKEDPQGRARGGLDFGHRQPAAQGQQIGEATGDIFDKLSKRYRFVANQGRVGR